MQVSPVAAADSDLGHIDSELWRQVRSETIQLLGVPAGMQPSSYIVKKWQDREVGRVKAVEFGALHNGSAIAFRLAWQDPEQDVSRKENESFPDGAAVMFPLKDDAPLVLMGSKEQPVNAWHWRADRPELARNNVAAGLGSSRVTRGSEIRTQARYRDDYWELIFLRELKLPDVSTAVDFSPGQRAKVALAVWEGSNGERGGLKAFSPQWIELTLGKLKAKG